MTSTSYQTVTLLDEIRYYALSAASALFKYAETKMNIRFAACSLMIRYVQVEGTMMIDPETARNLELANNTMFKRSSHSLFGCDHIFSSRQIYLISSSILNYTFTAMGARLLRVNILSPITGKLK